MSRDAALEPRDLHRDDDHVIISDRHRDAMEPPLDEPVHVISKRKVAEAPKIRHYKGQSAKNTPFQTSIISVTEELEKNYRIFGSRAFALRT